MRDYREALHRVAEVIRLCGKQEDTRAGLKKLASAVAGGAHDVMTLQALSAGCIMLLTDKLEEKRCGVSDMHSLQAFESMENTATTQRSGSKLP